MSGTARQVGHAQLRLYGGLGWFVDGLGASGQLDVPVATTRSVKDVVESVGVPHVELGVLLVDGEPVGLDAPVGPGARVSAYPPFAELPAPRPLRPPPPTPRRFVCDVHLGVLARLLRLAGFSTWWSRDADDAALAARAADEGRILLSRDRGLLKRRVVVHGQCPRSQDPDVQLEEVAARWDLAGRGAPFTRCAVCDGVLDDVAKAEVLDELPPRTRTDHHRFARCRDCGRIVWPGSHVDALRARHPTLLA